MLKRLTVAAVLVGCLGLGVSPSRADHQPRDFTESGTVVVGTGGGFLNILLGFCNPANPAQGVDGYWVTLPQDAPGHGFALSSGNGAPSVVGFAQRYTYDGGVGCRFVEGGDDGIVPAGAEFVLVSLLPIPPPPLLAYAVVFVDFTFNVRRVLA